MHCLRTRISLLCRQQGFAFASTSSRPLRDILGVGPNCTVEEVKDAFRLRAKDLHPDLQPVDQRKVAAERFKELQAAYDKLLAELQDGARVSPGSSAAGKAAWESGPSSDPQWEAVRQKASKSAKHIDGDDIFRTAMRGTAMLIICAAGWMSYTGRRDRRQELQDEAEFGAKRMRLRQQQAELEQRELQLRLAKKSRRAEYE
mmetsp:Transcript_69425/g.137266  ORF Transcript_69425/g.137266 Transcript_69425/m.137266 type:complete len:202 (+) Transcript_69425:49-654(+)